MAHWYSECSFEESQRRYRNLPVNMSKCRKNLGNLMTEDSEPLKIAHVNVYLRIKPLIDEENTCLYVENEHTLITSAPEDAPLAKQMRSKPTAPNCFRFSKIYDQTTSQKEIFDGSVLPLVDEFLKGKDSLLFAYGTSSAGKTFTMQGSEKHPGIIPRALDVLFNSLQGKIMKDIRYKPSTNYTVIALGEEEIIAENNLKKSILGWNPQEGSTFIQSVIHEKTSSTNSSLGASSTGDGSCMDGSVVFHIPESLKRERNSILLHEDENKVQYSIWVSFAEVYNESVYDLLDSLPGRLPANLKRPKLNLADDRYGSTYVRGLKEVCVATGDEACQVMLLGKCNLHFAATNLNHKSSRSHCVFTVKLLKLLEGNTVECKISTLSFCDLAGSERVEKSGNIGERLKETGNINTSLLVLGRCLKALRDNQSETRNPSRVPFRESKLTRMFQNALTGNGNVAMIVNVSQSPILFEETLNVLKYAAVAQQIVLAPMELQYSRINQPKNRFSVFIEKHKKNVAMDSIMSLQMIKEGAASSHSSDTSSAQKEIESLQEEIKRLEVELEETRKKGRDREDAVRSELCYKFGQMLTKERQSRKEALKDVEEGLVEYYTSIIDYTNDDYERRLQKLREKYSSKEESCEEPSEMSVAKDEQIAELERKISEMTEHNNELKAALNTLKGSQSESKLDSDRLLEEKVQELSRAANEISMLKSEVDTIANEKRVLKETLEEAAEDYSALKDTALTLERELVEKNRIIAEMEIRKENVSTVAIQCDLISEETKEKLQESQNSLVNMTQELSSKEAHYQELINEKDNEITSLQEAFKSVLTQNNAMGEMIRSLEDKKSEMEHRVTSLEKDLTEAHNMERKVSIARREPKSPSHSLGNNQESLQMLNLLEKELEKRRQENEKLLYENQGLRDVVDCKERELTSFQENQAKILNQYESLLSKSRDEVDVHRREEIRLRELLQLGTPNKYETKCQSLKNELSHLKRTLKTTLCQGCLARIPVEDKINRSLQAKKCDMSNENVDPRTRLLQRKSKSHSHLDVLDDSYDSDFMEHEPLRGRSRKFHSHKTFTGIDINSDPNYTMPNRVQSEERTPFKSSRRLMNPCENSMLTDLSCHMPAHPHTPADTIKRILRPRRR